MLHQNLFKRINKNDKQAFNELFVIYYAKLCRFALAFVADTDDSEDAVQRMFIRLWEKRKKLLVPENPKAYLYKAVYNECMKIAKSRSIREKHTINYLINSGLSENIENDTTSEQLAKYLNKAIEKLPNKCREIFIMNKLDGLTQCEIAGVLEISIKTVENQVAIALTKLREELKPIIHMLPTAFLFFINIRF